MPKISIIIIHYNTPHYLNTCLDAIFRQTYKNIEVIFIDNNSPDKSGLELVKKEYGEHKNLKIVDNKENLGYAKAANQGIDMASTPRDRTRNPFDRSNSDTEGSETDLPHSKSSDKADYIVITNPDIIYSPSYFEKIINKIEKEPSIASITGKVYKYDFENKKATKLIDTAGLFAYRNHRIIDGGQGLEDKGQFDKEEEVFGVSGACPLYRAKALQDVKIQGEYFDEDFFMYKEDVDIAWRFLLYGWKNYYYPKAIAYHGRGTGVYKRFTAKQIFKNRNKLSPFQKKYSFRNQRLMQAKNEMWGTFFYDFFPIIFKKIITIFYITFREPYLWKSFFDYIKLLPKALKKRKIIMKNKKISSKEMKKWFRKKLIT